MGKSFLQTKAPALFFFSSNLTLCKCSHLSEVYAVAFRSSQTRAWLADYKHAVLFITHPLVPGILLLRHTGKESPITILREAGVSLVYLQRCRQVRATE